MGIFINRAFVLCTLTLFFSGIFICSGHAKMVTVAKKWINLRSGPGTKYKVLWQLDKGYPLKVIKSKGKWYKVRDFENDTGWIHASLTSRKPHFIVKKNQVNVRSGPGKNRKRVAVAEKGTVFSTIKQVKGWVKVKHDKGIIGWVSRKLVWGW